MIIKNISHRIIPLDEDEIESVIGAREDKTYCTFKCGHKIVATKQN